jgi:hypothetical protein
LRHAILKIEPISGFIPKIEHRPFWLGLNSTEYGRDDAALAWQMSFPHGS